MPNDVDLSNEIWARAISNPSDLTDIDQIGFVALDGMLKEGFMLGLQQEGTNSLDTIKRASKQGKLTYSAGIAALGPMAQKLLHSSEMSGLLSMAFGGRYLLTDNMSCLTVYIPGDQLGPHIDQPASDCAATAILYLDADSPDPDCERMFAPNPVKALLGHTQGDDDVHMTAIILVGGVFESGGNLVPFHRLVIHQIGNL